MGAPKTVAVQAGETETVDFTVAYQKTGSVKGSVTVTKVPVGTGIWGKTAEACPSYAPNPNEVSADIVCATGGGSGNYSFPTLSPGTWILYPTYETEFGQSFGKAVSVSVVSGSTRTVNLTTPLLPPPGGIVSGSVKVSSFPASSGDLVGVLACKGSTVSYSCAGLKENPVSTNGASYGLPLDSGTWTLAAFYEPEPYGGLQYGPARTVHVVAGKIMTLPLTMVFKQPGAVGGKVTISGLPDGINILNYSVLACPAGSPFDGNPLDPECAGETSGVITSPLLGELGANTKIRGGPVCPGRQLVDFGGLLDATPSGELAALSRVFERIRTDSQHQRHPCHRGGRQDVDGELDAGLQDTHRRVDLGYDQLDRRADRDRGAGSGRCCGRGGVSLSHIDVAKRDLLQRHDEYRSEAVTTNWRFPPGHGGYRSSTGTSSPWVVGRVRAIR